MVLKALWVSEETKQRFDNHGKKGQSSDELLNQILEVFESEKGFGENNGK